MLLWHHGVISFSAIDLLFVRINWRVTNLYKSLRMEIKKHCEYEGAFQRSAWAVYNGNWYNSEGESVRSNIDVRFLEKVDGEWKIAYLSLVNTTSYDDEVDEGED